MKFDEKQDGSYPQLVAKERKTDTAERQLKSEKRLRKPEPSPKGGRQFNSHVIFCDRNGTWFYPLSRLLTTTVWPGVRADTLLLDHQRRACDVGVL
jgi:hypothetical protein